jgi:hypothetical protein
MPTIAKQEASLDGVTCKVRVRLALNFGWALVATSAAVRTATTMRTATAVRSAAATAARTVWGWRTVGRR